MLNIEVNNRNTLYRATKKATGLDDEALVLTAIEAGMKVLLQQAERRPATPKGFEDETPNAATLKAIRSKSTRGDKVFANGMDGVAYLRKRFA